jgi:hypothetical protein
MGSEKMDGFRDDRMVAMIERKRFFSSHAKSSALVTSVLLHVALLVAAISLVAVKVVIKPESQFEAKEIKRPRMNLRKLQVPVKESRRNAAPRLRQNILAKPKSPSMDIRMPEMVGVRGGMGYGAGSGLAGLGFGFEIPDLFGSNRRGSGNEFIGHFYDLKQTPAGRPTDIGELLARAQSSDWETDPDLIEASRLYREVVQRFLAGWNAGRLDNYFMAPREKFATTFVIPMIDAEEAPRAFGVEEQVKPMKWLALYRGQIVAPETGKYRFCGRGDDVLAVRVRKELVLDASFMNASGWRSSDPNSSKYAIYGSDNPWLGGMVIGDWFDLQAGRPMPMEVLLGEDPGGKFFCQLYVEREGESYPIRTETYPNPDTKDIETLRRPILPIFKTAEIPENVSRQMDVNPEWASLEGPSFGVAN